VNDILKLAGVYKITCLANGKFYIGSTKKFKQRWKEHRWKLKAGTHHSKYMQNCWNKYGEDTFKFEVLLVCEKQDKEVYEQSYLDLYTPEFNTCKVAGSNLGRKFSEETIQKMKKTKRAIVPKYDWNGESLCLIEISEKTGFDYSLLTSRVLMAGMSVQDAIDAGNSQIKLYEYNGEFKSVSAWAKEIGVAGPRLYWYTKNGLTNEEAIKRMDSIAKSISLSEFCRLNDISATTVKSRIKSGMTVMQAITTPVRKMKNNV